MHKICHAIIFSFCQRFEVFHSWAMATPCDFQLFLFAAVSSLIIHFYKILGLQNLLTNGRFTFYGGDSII